MVRFASGLFLTIAVSAVSMGQVNPTGSVPNTLLMLRPANGDTVDTSAQINAALAGLSTTGGKLTLASGVWYTTSSICVPSNTILEGTGNTIIRAAAGNLTPCVVGGQSWGGVIVASGVTNSIIRDITVDQLTNGGLGNGIEVGYSATPSVPSTNIIVQRTTILQYGGATGVHQYGIWINGATSVKVLNNFTNGGVASPSRAGVDQDGIEVLGATDVLVQGNSCINHNGNGIGIFSSGTSITVTSNSVTNTTVGIAANGYAAAIVKNLLIGYNRITTTASYGLWVSALAAGKTDGLLVTGNILDATHGMLLNGVSGSIWASAVVGQNVIKNTTTISNGAGIQLSYAAGVAVLGNTITVSDYDGVRADASTNLFFANNTIASATNLPIHLNQTTLTNQVSVISTTDLVCAHGGDTINSVACNNTAGTEGTTRTNFASGISIPAGFWAPGMALRVCAQFTSWSTATAAAISDIGITLGTTVITGHQGTMTTAASLANFGWSMCWRAVSTDMGDHVYTQPESHTYPSAAYTSFHNTTGQPQAWGVPAATLYVAVKFAATGLYSGTYTSGGSISGSAGQTCTLASFNNGATNATATVALTGTNTIAGGTALVVTNTGYGATSAPTSATLGNGTATCSGTATLSTVLGGAQGNGILKPTITLEKIQSIQ